MPGQAIRPMTRKSSRRVRNSPREGDTAVFLDPRQMIQRGSVARSQKHRFTRITTGTPIVTSTTVPTFVGLSFALSDLPGYTEFTNLFDQYRIDRIELKLIPNVTDSFPSSLLTGTIQSVIDYDDGNTPTTTTELLQYENCQVNNIVDSQVQLDFKPRVALAAYAGAFTSYANATSWIDSASPGVQHFGVKFCFSISASVVTTFTPIVKFHLTCRSER
jgi:hypothetical protein